MQHCFFSESFIFYFSYLRLSVCIFDIEFISIQFPFCEICLLQLPMVLLFLRSFFISSSTSRSQLSIVALIFHVSYFYLYVFLFFIYHFALSLVKSFYSSFDADPPKILILIKICSSLFHYCGYSVGYISLYPLVILMCFLINTSSVLD